MKARVHGFQKFSFKIVFPSLFALLSILIQYHIKYDEMLTEVEYKNITLCNTGGGE